MGEFDFTYILPENFEKRVVQYLLQLANRQLAEAFPHCKYEYEDVGLAYYAGLRGDNWNKRALDFTFEGADKDISVLKRADKKLKEYLANNDEARKEFEENQKLKNDPRITKIGDFLRKTSIDELPQLINVLKGEMSLIGPRPIVDGEIEKYGTNKDKFLSVKPGLTGYWAANGRNNITYSERIKMELYYVDNMSFGLDLKIFFKTIVSVIKKEGAN